MSKTPTVSAVLITKNEAKRIRKTLRSLTWVDEIIIVDSGSTDETLEICKAFNASIYQHDWLGFGPQKQLALDYATSDWVFSIDADEVVSADLKIAIQEAVKKPDHDAYKIRRRLIFQNKKIKHACGEERILRLAKRDAAYFDKKLVHEAMHAKSSIGLLDGTLWHDSFANIDAMIDKMNRYTTLAATRKKKASLGKAIFRSAWMFCKVYLFKAGFLDGASGFILAYYFAENTYYKYIKQIGSKL